VKKGKKSGARGWGPSWIAGPSSRIGTLDESLSDYLVDQPRESKKREKGEMTERGEGNYCIDETKHHSNGNRAAMPNYEPNEPEE